MTDIDKFLNIFAGSFSAYGQTRKTDEFDDRGKHKTKSFIIKKQPTDQMFQEHLESSFFFHQGAPGGAQSGTYPQNTVSVLEKSEKPGVLIAADGKL